MKVFLDMDGVLTDFVGGSLFLHDIPPESYDPRGEWDMGKVLGMTEEEFWAPIDELGEPFWEQLRWTRDGLAILRLVEHLFGFGNVCILSSTPTSCPESASGKIKWIRKHLPDHRKRFLLGPSKGFAASLDKLLIDDRDSNVEEFRDAGGKAILVPRPWNTGYLNSYRTVEALADSLGSFSVKRKSS